MSKITENNKEKEYKKISVNNLLALARTLDTYKIFNKRLKKFVSNKFNRGDILSLYKISKGEFVFSMRARRFYSDNKRIIDSISHYTSSSDFIDYVYKSVYSSQGEMNYFYKYFNKNKDKINNIINLLEKIQELGFQEIKFNEEEDFTNKQYKINAYMRESIISSIIADINFLENMELIPNYESDIIKYKTNGSNYCMMLPNRSDAKDWPGKEIILNNLLFDVGRLPKSLKKKDTIDKIISLKETKKNEETSIRDLVNLGVKIFDFEKEYARLEYIVEKLENVKSKDELKKVLSNIKIQLEQLKQINKNEIRENVDISEEQIESEKKLYIRNRDFQYLDLD